MSIKNILKTESVLAAAVLVAAAACGPAAKSLPAPAGPSDAVLLEEAIQLRAGESYRSLKKAFGLFGDIYPRMSGRNQLLVPYLETSLLLAVRGKELGIADPAPLAAAERLIRNHRSLEGFRDLFNIASVLSVKTKGVLTDIDGKFTWIQTEKDLKLLEPAIRHRALTDEFTAVIYTAWISDRFDYEKLKSLDEIFGRYPSSKSLLYKAATSRQAIDTDALLKLLAMDPEFAEAHFQLGQAALGKGSLLEAEREFLAAYAGIPESPETRILLGSIYFATEETEKSLEFYEKTLEIAPEYRDAILGKAICLTSLGRNEEAIATLERNIALGYWLLGETHFWLAWNRRELKDNTRAAVHIEEAKTRLGTAPEVFALSGTIQFELGDLVRAEADFREALRPHRYNTDALLGLGNVLSKKEIWVEAGETYLEAAASSRASALAVQTKIDEIKTSSFPPERKEPLLKKKNAQLESHLQSEAMAYYLAAATLANGGRMAGALQAAERAAGHALYKQKAEELAAKIRALKGS